MIIAAAGVTLAAMAAGFSGFGLILFGAPFLEFVYRPRTVVAVMLLLSLLTTGGVALVPGWGKLVNGRSAAGLAASSIIGLPIGVAILLFANPQILRLIMGVIVCVYAVLGLRGRFSGAQLPELPARLVAGFLAGMLSTSTGLSGPPLVAYLSLEERERSSFRATLGATLFVLTVCSLVIMWTQGLLEANVIWLAVELAPGVALGFVIGTGISRLTSNARFMRTMLVGLFAIGFVLTATSSVPVLVG